MLYHRFYKRLEGVRWSMEQDVPWTSIQKEKLSREQLQFVKANALIEWTAVDASEAFLRDFQNNSDFSSFISVWFFEEMKHFLVLKRYVEQFGLEVTAGECQRMRSPVKPASSANILTVHFIGELRLALWYNTLARIFPEPVLQKIYKLIAHDEIRHGMCYYQFLKRLLAERPKDILTVLKTSLFMLRQPVHPTVLTGTVAGLEGVDRVYAFVNEAVDPREEQATHRKVLQYLSSVSNLPLRSIKDILSHTKRLRMEFGGAY